ncbi:MAG: complex I subunit 1 family protein [Candidatus Omnitrophota bacterium]|jgi:NADH-quinone oxidoreductase subunit H
MSALFSILIFPGILFVSVAALFAEFLDRRIYARLQNRFGPPWFQPFADFIKLIGKEEIVPKDANPTMFKAMPIFAFASAVCAFLYVPLYKPASLFAFDGDVIVVLYLLTIPTLTFFIGGWYSTSLYSRIGSVRSLMQLFSYEVPLFIGILSSAVLADTWSLSGISIFYGAHHWYWVFNLIGFFVCLIALLAKLEKGPFDIPEAETEIVAGCFTEYSGRHFALLRLTLDVEMIVGASFLAAVFLPFGYEFGVLIGFVIFLLKVLFILCLLSLARTILARMRIDQMINFCWRFLVPLAFVQLLLNLVIKGVILR